MKRLILTATSALMLLASGCSDSAKHPGNLVPDTPSDAPDYMCTWNIQGFVHDQAGPERFREAMTEDYIFGEGKYENWINFFPSIKEDLYFVMDDSWDIPADVNNGDNNYLGTVELDQTRFPSFTGTPVERLAKLTRKIKDMGWKGAGGWICAQKSDRYPDVPEEEFWTERLKAANEAGFSYWKVDWGHNQRNEQWRKMLTRLSKEHAPELWIEHAMEFEYVEFSDVFRTYDVENVIAQPLTIRRVSAMLSYKAQEGVKGIINCEDEPYIAAGLGCAIGIMRHPIDGPTPSGLKDNAFPPVGHNYKKCLDEIVRGVRWHRIAEPFGVNNDGQCDPTRLEDYWIYNDRDSWVGRDEGSIMREEAPAIVSRAMPLPEVKDTSSDRPYILASTYPNGALAVAAIGRALGREYVTKEIDVKVKGSEWDAPVGLFGYFKSVTIEYPSVAPEKARIWAQDLAGDTPVEITDEVKIDGNKITVSGDVIKRVGLMNATEGDLSAPGLVLKVF